MELLSKWILNNMLVLIPIGVSTCLIVAPACHRVLIQNVQHTKNLKLLNWEIFTKHNQLRYFTWIIFDTNCILKTVNSI